METPTSPTPLRLIIGPQQGEASELQRLGRIVAESCLRKLDWYAANATEAEGGKNTSMAVGMLVESGPPLTEAVRILNAYVARRKKRTA